jgi:transcriptional regulator with XRE-family HTH domain
MATHRPSRAERQRAIGQILKALRMEAGLRQVDVASRLGVPQSLISKVEAGERTADVFEVLDVCHAIGVPVADFLDRLQRAANDGIGTPSA